MLRNSSQIAAIGTLFVMAACDSGRHSSAGFRLPSDGDIQRGKVAFVELECAKCHQVAGADLPKPTIQPPVPVQLGGTVTKEVSDGYLVASIINPSYKLANYPAGMITEHGKSRMPEYADRITVRQMTDVVAFLQSHYTVREPSMIRQVY